MAAEVKEALVAVPRAEGRNFSVLPDPYLWLLTRELVLPARVRHRKKAEKEAALGCQLQHSSWGITGSVELVMQAPACWSCGPSVPALQCQTGEIPRNYFPV